MVNNDNNQMKSEESEWIEEAICAVNGQRMLKRYRKLKVVGEGSYSKCWLVQTDNSDSTYVAKIIPKKKLQLLVKEKLVYQIRIHQQLSHPNVVHLDHWFQDENFQYIFMEYCSEGNLQKKLQANNLHEKEIRHYVRQIVQAITYIHSKNILHRDLKLCNFYLDSSNNLKLGDFGFACQLSHPGELKRETCGTPNFIAPEAVSGFGYSFSSDVWAIGVILYRLKFRMCPFEGRTVRETLEKVKLCQYSFPKNVKISQELKDLIQKIFVINYDERLTLTQILNHPFLGGQTPKPPRPKSESKGGFAILKSIFSKQKDPKEPESRKSRISESQKKDETAKRSNSCETFKQIKQIFKNKSKPTLVTENNSTEMKTEEASSYMTRLDTTNRDRSFMGGSTLRSIADTALGMNAINKRLQTTTRMNHLLGNVKEQLKLQAKGQLMPKHPTSGGQLLASLAKKYYLPSEVQFEKDVVVVTYKQSVKQLLYRGNGYLLHRHKHTLYDMSGQLFTNPPKLLKYIVDNRVTIAEAEPEEEEYGQNTMERILLFVAHRWHTLKDGVLLKFGNSGVFVAKMVNQQLFYAGSATREGEDGKISLMYAREGGAYKCAEGVVLSRIYQGWVANALKQPPLKE